MTALTLFQQELPDYLKDVELNDLTKSLAGNTGSKRISIRGGVFRLVVSGEEIAKNENRFMNVVIVSGAPSIARSFHTSKYVAGETSAPDCWSNDGRAPDASIEAPQSSTCNECPQNIKGSGQGESKACRYLQRLAVTLADDIGGDVFQLTLPSKSIFGRGDADKMPFQQYAKYVGSQGRNIDQLVTEMRMDSDSDTPKLVFKPVRFLTRDEWAIARSQGSTPAAKSAVIQTPVEKKKAAPQIAAPQIAAPAKTAAVEEPEGEVIEEPKKRAAKKNAEPTPKKGFADVISSWTDDDE
jgi:hypothetical protein